MKVSLDTLMSHARALRSAVSSLGSGGALSQQALSSGTQGLSRSDQATLQAAYDYLSKRGVVTPQRMDSLLNEAAANAARADRNSDGFLSGREARGLGAVSQRLVQSASDGFGAGSNASTAAGAQAAAAAQPNGSQGVPGAQRINNVLNGLDVEHNRRYLPSGTRGTSSRVTHCNQFAQEVMRQVGVPRQNMPTGNANQMNRWLNNQGAAHGWHQVSAAEAQRMANQGHPVLASWQNTRGPHGHVAVVKPGHTDGVHIAQAGGHNYNDAPVQRGFGRHQPQYFVYDGPVNGATQAPTATAAPSAAQPSAAAPAPAAPAPAAPTSDAPASTAPVSGNSGTVRALDAAALLANRATADASAAQGQPLQVRNFIGTHSPIVAARDNGRVGAFTYRAKMDVDSDGAPGITHAQDPDHQAATALRFKQGYADASKLPYVVLPPALAKATGAKLGDLVQVSYNGKTAYAIYGDVGPSNKLGEGSMDLARRLGINPDPRRGGTHDENVQYTVLPGSGRAAGIVNGGDAPTADQVQAAGAAAFASARQAGLVN